MYLCDIAQNMSKDIFQQISDRTKKFEQHFGDFDKKKVPIKEMSVREMLSITRPKLNEDAERSISQAEIDREQEKMLNYFADDSVDIQFKHFIVKPNAVFMSGTIDGQVLFAYTVAPEETNDTKGVQVEYLDGFDPSNPDNDKIIKKVQAYYNDFYKYWRDNELQLNGI